MRSDLSVFQFLNSDFTCVNETLAEHYGIMGVKGQGFRKVKLTEAHHRGGVLTQAKHFFIHAYVRRVWGMPGGSYKAAADALTTAGYPTKAGCVRSAVCIAPNNSRGL